MPHATIIGAGIGGLSAALALRGKGWNVTVYERAEHLEPVGAGIAIAPNALRALDTIGLGSELRCPSAVSGSIGSIRDQNGRTLWRTTDPGITSRFGDSIVLLPRPRLIAAMAARLAPSALRLGATAEVRDSHSGTVSVDGTTHVSELVVAADGIASGTRSTLFPALAAPRSTGTTAWRTIVSAEGLDVQPTEYWGHGSLLGTMPMEGDLVYIYATAAAPDHTAAHDRAWLQARFGDWAAPVPALLRRTQSQAILRNTVRVLPRLPSMFHSGRVALLGDAAHPMEPNLGQGACQAIEDAVVLAHVAEAGLQEYTKARLGRSRMVVNRSHTMARAARIRHPVAVAARNTALRLATRLPGGMINSGRRIFAWTPPSTVSP